MPSFGTGFQLKVCSTQLPQEISKPSIHEFTQKPSFVSSQNPMPTQVVTFKFYLKNPNVSQILMPTPKKLLNTEQF